MGCVVSCRWGGGVTYLGTWVAGCLGGPARELGLELWSCPANRWSNGCIIAETFPIEPAEAPAESLQSARNSHALRRRHTAAR